MRSAFVLGLAMLAAAMPAAAWAKKDVDKASEPIVQQAFGAIQQGNPARATELIAPVLADYEAYYAGEKRRIYCSPTPETTLAYMTLAASEKADAVAINPGWCTAQYIRAFALIDLDRLDEAQTAFERLVGFAPMNPRYLNELAYVLLKKKQWQKSIEIYRRAEDAAGFSATREDNERCTALRGVGYDLVELGQLDEAEKAYRKCLTILPGDEKSLGEIEYIDEQRKKTT